MTGDRAGASLVSSSTLARSYQLWFAHGAQSNLCEESSMADADISPEKLARAQALKDKVHGLLSQIADGYQVDSEGDSFIEYGSSRIYFSTHPFGDDGTVVEIWCLLLINVTITPELFEYVACEGANYHFGSMIVRRSPDDPSVGQVVFSHSLLGDYLDLEELKVAALGVLFAADDIDNELAGRFGGTTFTGETS